MKKKNLNGEKSTKDVERNVTVKGYNVLFGWIAMMSRVLVERLWNMVL